MTITNDEPMSFIDTIDDDDDVTLYRVIMIDDVDDKYDQLSQINTSWKVYDADDELEEEEDIKQ